VLRFLYRFNEMSEATETKEINTVASELDQPRWSVVSFERCEASALAYSEAVRLLSEKEAAGVNGLCIVTDEAAQRVNT
jgi:hypothetical protein